MKIITKVTFVMLSDTWGKIHRSDNETKIKGINILESLSKKYQLKSGVMGMFHFLSKKQIRETFMELQKILNESNNSSK